MLISITLLQINAFILGIALTNFIAMLYMIINYYVSAAAVNKRPKAYPVQLYYMENLTLKECA